MRSMNATEFKAKCLAVLDEVEKTGEPVLILKRGRLIARLTSAYAVKEPRRKDWLRGTVEVVGDIIGPVLPASSWNAISGKQ